MLDLKLRLGVTRDKVSVCRLPADSPIPMWAFESDFFSITKTPDELSIVCSEKIIPEDIQKESNYRVIKVEGPLDFSLVGILAEISTRLAQRDISLFAISSYDTDYILVKESKLEDAILALTDAGHDIKRQ